MSWYPWADIDYGREIDVKVEHAMITWEYELDTDDWCVKRGNYTMCRIADEYVSSVAADFNMTKSQAVEYLVAEMYLSWFMWNDSVVERCMTKLVFP